MILPHPSMKLGFCLTNVKLPSPVSVELTVLNVPSIQQDVPDNNLKEHLTPKITGDPGISAKVLDSPALIFYLIPTCDQNVILSIGLACRPLLGIPALQRSGWLLQMLSLLHVKGQLRHIVCTLLHNPFMF